MIFEKIEDFYVTNKENLKLYEKIISDTFDLPNNLSKRTVKRILVLYISKRSKINIFSKMTIYMSFLLVIPLFVYLVILLFQSKRIIKKTEFYDVAFDCWGDNAKHNQLYFERFYLNFNNLLKDKKRAIFEPYNKKDNSDIIASLNNISLIKSNYNNIQSRIIIRIIKYYSRYIFKMIRLSLKMNTNFIIIFMKILRQYIIHQKNTQNINSIKYLISAGDNYYTPLMYYIYKNNGIDNIYLIQNGTRNEAMDSSFYITCDKYFSISDTMVDNYLGLKAYNCIINICSLRLYDATYKINKNKQTYDIVFIGGASGNDIFNNKKHKLYKITENYLEALKLLAEFSNKNKQYNIIYTDKPKNKPEKYTTYINLRNEIINSSNILLDSNLHKNSYEAIVDSKVVIYSDSTLGFESIVLGKNVLCCNFGNFDFLLSQNDEIGVIINNDYKIFEKKIFKLLKNDSIVERYFKKKRNLYGDISQNPYEIILNNIDIGKKCH